MFHNKYILIRNLATMFIVCNLLNGFFPFPPAIWRVGLVLLSLYAVVFNGQKTAVEKMILVFTVFNFFHFIVSFLWLTPSTTQIGNILCAMLSFVLFIYLGKNGVMTIKYFSITILCLLVASLFAYFHLQAIVIENLMVDSDTDFTNNASASFLFLLPMLFFIRKKWLKWSVLVVCLYFILASAKRGNIIGAVIPTLMFVWFELKESKHSVFKTILVIIGMIALSVTLYQWFTTNDYLMYRLENTMEGNSSGRDEIFTQALSGWTNSDNVGHYLFGYGFDGTLHHIFLNGQGMRAHNDWLEILVDYGLIGVILYLSVFISFAKMIRKTNNIQIKLVMLCAVCIWLFKSAYSMGFVEGKMFVLMISLGTAVGQNTIQNDELIPNDQTI